MALAFWLDTERSGRRSRPIRLRALSAAHLVTFTFSLTYTLSLTLSLSLSFPNLNF